MVIGPSADAATTVVLVDLAVVVTLGGVLARLAERWGQPPVVGEIIAGIALGPSLLGLLPGHLTDTLFPAAERPFLGVLANLGLVLFMYGVGYEVDLDHVRRAKSSVAAVAAGSTALPLAMGAGLALLLWPYHRAALPHHVDETAFVLFVGVAMSITAFPVLARILTDRGLHRSRLGSFAMTCAAAVDATAWGMLAIVVALASGGGLSATAWRIGGLLLFVGVLVAVARPLLRLALRSRSIGASERGPLIVTFVGLLLAAWITAKLGFHPIFGAFAFGAATPRDAMDEAAPEAPLLIDRTGRLLVPIFFVTTGLTVDIAGIGVRGCVEALLVLAVACAGKFLGAAGAARMGGMDARRAAAVGVLMNSRGLTELVVIQTGVAVGALDGGLATVMIIMAVVTTVVTTPLFRRVYGEDLRGEDEQPARRPDIALPAAA